MSLADRFGRTYHRRKKEKHIFFLAIVVIWECFISLAGSDVTLYLKSNTINNNEKARICSHI